MVKGFNIPNGIMGQCSENKLKCFFFFFSSCGLVHQWSTNYSLHTGYPKKDSGTCFRIIRKQRLVCHATYNFSFAYTTKHAQLLHNPIKTDLLRHLLELEESFY